MTTWMQTRSGKRFDFLAPSSDDITLDDIAWALAHQCRFNGHVDKFYSVAEHSIWVSSFCDEWKQQALMHDAAEAYVGDVVSPLKQFLPGFQSMELQTWACIAQKFDLLKDMPIEIMQVDRRMQVTEREQLFQTGTPRGDFPGMYNIMLRCWEPQRAYEKFLEAAHKLGLK